MGIWGSTYSEEEELLTGGTVESTSSMAWTSSVSIDGGRFCPPRCFGTSSGGPLSVMNPSRVSVIELSSSGA